ncbi:2-oxoglutarate-dependent dioxygenase AOP1.2 [Spatholobus suberectus]|nr:2-oxoglutarate-dependent dioxygenase AOP1.2 [Spatholobus suberectus]
MILESLGVEEYLEEHMNSTNYLLRVMKYKGPQTNDTKAWSKGKLHSPFHRMMMSGNEARYSIGLFSVPKGGSIIKAPKELVDEEHLLLFKPFDLVQFLNYYYTEKGQRDQFAMRTYCGV